MFNKIYYVFNHQYTFSFDSTKIIFIQHKYLFNFNQKQFYLTGIFVQLQAKLFSSNNNICSTSPKLFSFNNNNYSTSTKIIFI